MNLGNKISKIRKDNNMSQEEFAKIFNVTRQTVSSWENSKSYPDIETLTKISDKFNISLDILLKEDKKMIKALDSKLKKHKKYKVVLIILIILILIGLYFGYKGFYIIKYNAFNIEDKEFTKLKNFMDIKDDSITIKSQKLKEEEYLDFDSVKIKNDFKDFTPDLSSSDISTTVIYKLKDGDSDKNVKAAFWMGKTDTYIHRLLNETNLKEFGNKLLKDDMEKFMNKNKIKTDIDLFNYMAKYKNTKINLFSSLKDIKQQGIIYYIYQNLPIGESINLINGDYKGYMFTFDNIRQAYIMRNDSLYFFTFVYDYFTDEYINELLNTVVIR